MHQVDIETREDLEDIAFFDRKSVAAWLRELVVDAVKRYQRISQFKKLREIWSR